MKTDNHLRHLIHLNLAMLLMSTSGALGRYIAMPPPITIWWRALLAAGFLLIYCKWRKVNLKVNLSVDGFSFFAAALLLGGHWVTYFYALQLSNVAIGMLSLFTYPVFTSLLEPLLLRTRFRPSHLLLGVLVLAGIYLLAPEFDLENTHTRGIAFGLLSSLLYSLRNILLKTKVTRYDGSVLMYYQLIIIAAVLWPALLLFHSPDTLSQLPAVATLALITTAIGHTLFIVGLKHFSATTASIISSSQPIYGIIIGMIFLHEVPGWNTVAGGALILATVIIESVRSFRVAGNR